MPLAKDADSPSADIMLGRAIQSRQQEALRNNLAVLSLTSRSHHLPQAVSDQVIQQLMHAEEEMRIFHQEDNQRHEAIVMNLIAKLDELMQEDQGSTMRIEELERQCDFLHAAVGHVNQVHHSSTEEYVHVVRRIEEASHAQHLRDEEVAESLYHELGQLRSEFSDGVPGRAQLVLRPERSQHTAVEFWATRH